ncbi:MAG: AhpC/TSA family protein [Flavobacteriales bacterium]|nr:AhpC/TSA family protein [Flavobacteriales bacterium]
MKKLILSVWLVLLFCTIAYIFWHEDWKYSLPTPIPADYVEIQPGDKVNIGNEVKRREGAPLFLHFFNPSCPCSRFNIPHFRSLVRDYGNQIAFAIVVMHDKNQHSVEDIRKRFGLDTIPIYFDKNIADSCGVYSTPQAALIDGDGRLCYRGNYNKSRYCTDRGTYYAKMAVDSLLKGTFAPITDIAAIKSYGCSLPVCTK